MAANIVATGKAITKLAVSAKTDKATSTSVTLSVVISGTESQ